MGYVAGYVGVGHLSDLQACHPDTSPAKRPLLNHIHRYHCTYAYPAARFGSKRSRRLPKLTFRRVGRPSG